jgi:hypothetical protein
MAIQKISTAVIADNSIDADKIAAGAITVADIPDGEITDAKIDTVSASKVTGEIGTSQIANNNVTTDKIADGQITSAKMASNITLQAADYILDGISETLANSAVDFVIYDTSKDSDGGAWRNRTQDATWYNETLNTATRGSRREFPSVAVIVAESSRVIIYDGDDPTLPMWMIADESTNFFREGSISSIAAAEGNLVVGCRPYDSYVVNFPKDRTIEVATGRLTAWNGLANRNNTTNPNDFSYDISRESSATGLLSRFVIDVDIKVMPNASIDEETGLYNPTIVFAQNTSETTGAISVLHHDLQTGHINGYDAPWYNVNFHGNDIVGQRNTQGFYIIPFEQIPVGNNAVNENTAVASGRRYQDLYDTFGMYINHPDLTPQKIISAGDTSLVTGYSAGLTLIDENLATRNHGMVCNITEDSTSGWMHGDIRLAALASTEAVNGNELIVNGTFSAGVSNWTQEPGTTGTIQDMGGYARVTRGGGSGPSFYQAVTTVPGETYTCSAVLNSVQTRIDFSARDNIFSSGGQTINRAVGPGIGAGSAEKGFSFTAVGTTTYLYIDVDNNGAYGEADNLSMSISVADRSYNAEGFQAIGGISTSPVATGAELLSYSGWDYPTNSYLRKSYSGKFDWGTSDFCWMGWFKSNGGTGPIIGHGDNANTGFLVEIHNTGGFKYIDAGYLGITNSFARNNSKLGAFYGATTQNEWNHFCIVSQGGTFKVWANGVKGDDEWSGATVPDWSTRWAYPRTTIGCRSQGGSIANFGSSNIELALIKASATVPTDDQIKKIYYDEKQLFESGSNVTVYGSSRTVTALAHDKDKDLLHVGTSSGRSVFQGLRRIDNTTDAVSTAISANKGMVAEQ